MDIEQAQADMRRGYLHGAPGVLASALVWLCAAAVAWTRTPDASIATLFIGGMFIHPAGMLIAKALGRPGAHSKGNPLGALALEVTILMLLALPLVYAVSRLRIEWFFPAMLMVIGGRYLTFSTMYGLRVFWACGATLAAGACALVLSHAGFATGALTGGVIELLFAGLLFQLARRVSGPVALSA
jgi:hypothetical protein